MIFDKYKFYRLPNKDWCCIVFGVKSIYGNVRGVNSGIVVEDSQHPSFISSVKIVLTQHKRFKKMKPTLVSGGEWYFMGCFIQRQDIRPSAEPFHVFQDNKDQTSVGSCFTFTEAKKICRLNKVDKPLIGLRALIT